MNIYVFRDAQTFPDLNQETEIVINVRRSLKIIKRIHLNRLKVIVEATE